MPPACKKQTGAIKAQPLPVTIETIPTKVSTNGLERIPLFFSRCLSRPSSPLSLSCSLLCLSNNMPTLHRRYPTETTQ